MAQKDKKVANPSDGRKYFLINTTLLPPIQGLKKLSYSWEHTETLNSHSIEEDNKHIKYVPSTFEDQRKLFLMELKSPRPSPGTSSFKCI